METLRGSQVIAVGDNGAERVRLLSGPGSAASVRVLDANGQDRIDMLQSRDADSGFLLRSPSGMSVMGLGMVANDPELPGPLLHSANLILRDESGHDRIRLLVADDGSPTIELINAAGDLVWSVP